MSAIGAFFRLIPPVGVLTIGLLLLNWSKYFEFALILCPLAFCWLIVVTVSVAKSLRV